MTANLSGLSPLAPGDEPGNHLALRDGQLVITAITPDVRRVAQCARAIREARKEGAA